MAKKRRKHSDAFKAQVVEQILNGGGTQRTCAEYGLAPSMVNRWMRQARDASRAPKRPKPHPSHPGPQKPPRSDAEVRQAAKGSARGISVDTSAYPFDAKKKIESRRVKHNGRDFVIRRNVPLPGPTATSKYPLDALELGDSLCVKRTEHAKVQYAVNRFRTWAKESGDPRVLILRQLDDGNYGVFRVK